MLPDGRPELILHLGDRFTRVDANGCTEMQSTMIVAGQLTGPLVLRPTGRVSVLGVRLRPYGAAALLRAPQTAFIGHTLDAELASAALAPTLRSIRNRAESAAEAVENLQVELARHIAAERIGYQPAGDALTAWIDGGDASKGRRNSR